MFVGHIGAGLAFKRVEPRLNLGLLVAAALFADLLLWILVLAGLEAVLPPPDSVIPRYFRFVFPYSHSVATSIGWSILAGAAVWRLVPLGTPRRLGLAVVIALAVLSHFVLDFLVHVSDLPPLSDSSPKLGLALWAHMPVALIVELTIASIGLMLYLRGAHLTRGRMWLAIGIVGLTGVLTAAGPYMPGPPPSPTTLAASSLVTLLIVVCLAFVVEGRASITIARPVVAIGSKVLVAPVNHDA